jgi:hypothetical protein
MTIFVAEINGRGVAAFHSDSVPGAERIIRDRVFRDDLMVLATGALPLWDGVAEIQLRAARPDEAARWRVSHARAIRDGNIDGQDGAWITFLVPLADPTRRRRRAISALNR